MTTIAGNASGRGRVRAGRVPPGDRRREREPASGGRDGDSRAAGPSRAPVIPLRPWAEGLAAWGPAWVAAAALLARTAWPGGLAPFHLAFCAVVPARRRVPAALAAVAVVALGRGWAAAALDALALAVLVLLGRQVPAAHPAGAAGQAALAALVAGGVRAGLAPVAAAELLVAAFQAACAGLLAPVFGAALAAVERLVRSRADGWPVSLAVEDLLAVGTLAAALLLGLSGLPAGPLDPGLALAGTLILGAASVGGVGLAAAVAGCYAALASLAGGVDPVGALAQVTGGVLAGVLRGFGPAGTVGGYGLASLALSALYERPEEASRTLASVLAGAGLFLALPRLRSPRGPRWNLPPVRLRLPLRPVPPWDGAAPRVPAAVPAGPAAGAALSGIARVCQELARAVAEAVPAPPADRRQGRPGLAELVGAVASRACRGCPLGKACWERDFLRSYAGIAAALGRCAEAGTVSERDLPEHLRRRCPRRPALLAAIRETCADGGGTLREGPPPGMGDERHLVAAQLRALGEALARLASREARPPEPRRLAYRVGLARVPRDGSRVSGDSCLARTLEDGRLVLALSDGMGSGWRAARQSRTAVQLLEQMLAAGFAEDDAVRAINAALMLRSGAEVFATLDLALVDLACGHACFVKVGASPSFLRRAGRVTVLRCATPPAGVLPELDVRVDRRSLLPGDLLVMTSDGVLLAWEDPDAAEAWLAGYLSSLASDDPRRVAAAVVEEALRRYGGKPRDDLTVMALRLG